MVDEKMLNFVKDFIESHDAIGTKLQRRFPFRSLYDHCFRCCKWAQRINEFEGGDPEVTQISALFHDVGKCADNTVQGHAEAGARICGEYLDSIGFDANKRDRITRIVRLHIEHCSGEESSVEGIIESDADPLDETGAMTVLWDCMAVGAEDQQSYQIAYDRVRGAFETLQTKTRSSFHTATGWRFFEERREFLGDFVANLEFELGIVKELKKDPH